LLFSFDSSRAETTGIVDSSFSLTSVDLLTSGFSLSLLPSLGLISLLSAYKDLGDSVF
jgi:hypothetical protein